MKQIIPKILWISFILFMVTTSSAQHISGQLGVGFQTGLIKLIGGEVDDSIADYASGIFLKYSFSEVLTSEITACLGWVRPRDPESHFKVRTKEPYRTYLYPWSVSLRYNLRPEKRLIPYLGIGAGLTYWDLRDISEEDEWNPIPPSGTTISETQTNLTIVGVMGTSLFITRKLGIDLGVRYSRLLDQNLDNIGTGDVNDGIIEIRFNLGYFFGGYRDSDGDGIEDGKDKAPYQPEDFDFFEDEDGIPDLDNDEDGIPDEIDQAPNLPEDIDGFQDEDGLPELDDDNDGIEDALDQCPLEPEDYDGFQDEDGCPDPDNDQDGIPDQVDRCPNEPENFNGYQDNDGCPDNVPESPLIERGRSLILPGVTFNTNSAELTENAKIILDTVFESLRDNIDIRVEIRGYTDNTGQAATNLNLSQRRAASVRNYLIMKGITSDRLRAIGYGESNAIASNSTSEGRARNRRIEFVRAED